MPWLTPGSSVPYDGAIAKRGTVEQDFVEQMGASSERPQPVDHSFPQFAGLKVVQ